MSKARGRGAEIRRLRREFGLSREEALQAPTPEDALAALRIQQAPGAAPVGEEKSA